MRRFISVIASMAVALTAAISVSSPAMAASPGGCTHKYLWTFVVDSCISGRGKTAYPDYYFNTKPKDDQTSCTVTAVLKGSGVNKTLDIDGCSSAYAFRHIGPFPTAVSIGPGLCYYTQITVVLNGKFARANSPKLCF